MKRRGKITYGKIKLSKNETTKICTIKRDVDHWYVSFGVEIEEYIWPVNITFAVSVDVGLKHLAKSISDAGWYQLMEYTKF